MIIIYRRIVNPLKNLNPTNQSTQYIRYFFLLYYGCWKHCFQGNFFIIFKLICIIIFQKDNVLLPNLMGFNTFLIFRLFYTSHLVQIICHILESLSDVRQFRRVGQGLIFAGTIHHSHNKTHLWFIFILHKILR